MVCRELTLALWTIHQTNLIYCLRMCGGAPSRDIDADRAVNKCNGAARRIQFAAGSVIVSVGREAGSIFLIVAGEVEVYLQVNGSFEKRLTTLGPGMSFGEMAMVNRERRTANAHATVNLLRDRFCGAR